MDIVLFSPVSGHYVTLWGRSLTPPYLSDFGTFLSTCNASLCTRNIAKETLKRKTLSPAFSRWLLFLPSFHRNNSIIIFPFCWSRAECCDPLCAPKKTLWSHMKCFILFFKKRCVSCVLYDKYPKLVLMMFQKGLAPLIFSPFIRHWMFSFLFLMWADHFMTLGVLDCRILCVERVCVGEYVGRLVCEVT